ncbi:MAG: hypothetical protein JO306_15480, partial [Gemmatimonadetes bacterium]|nr:hypothetical protein [Gemmatimonadota bacterium]
KSFIIPNAFAYRRVDLRLQKDLVSGPNRVSILGEAYNAFNFNNYGCFDTWTPAKPEVNQHFGAPTCSDPARRFQLGVTYSFR